jgi:excisionase family DNA binding protein
MESEKMTPEEVAEELRVTVDTVWRWCRAGLGTKYGGQYRITREEIAAFFPKDTPAGLRA